MKEFIVGMLSSISNINIACWLVIFGDYIKCIHEISNMKIHSIFLVILGIIIGELFFSQFNMNELFFIGLLLGGLPQITQKIKIKRVDLSHLLLFILAFIFNITMYQYSLTKKTPVVFQSIYFLIPGMKVEPVHVDALFVLSFILSLCLLSQILKRLFNQFKVHTFCAILGFVVAIITMLLIHVISKGINLTDYLFLIFGCVLTFTFGGKIYDKN